MPWIARGDEAAFRLFFEATNGLLFGLLLRILGHTQTAEEVLSDLYEEVRHRASQFGKQNEARYLAYTYDTPACHRASLQATQHE